MRIIWIFFFFFFALNDIWYDVECEDNKVYCILQEVEEEETHFA